MPAARYHADPVAQLSLSASIAHILLSQSPAHARWAHPRLNPSWQDSEPTTQQDEGTALHAAILENRGVVALCDFPDWRKKEAQEARRLARETGKVPILAHRWAEIEGTAAAVRAALRGHEVGDVLASGVAERVMVWREDTAAGPVWCRSRVDWLRATTAPIGYVWDLKTVGGSAEPGAWGKKLTSDGYALQAAFYLRGARALGLEPSGFRFIVVERDAPHGVSVCECAPDLMHFAEQQARAALELWGQCIHSGEWPSYPPRVAAVEAPSWAMMQWEERALRVERETKAKPFYMPESQRVVNSGAPFA
nr:PD-(D/E)XK nuclease-like domain-containing protein [Neoroseomonas eburnea]